MIATAVVPYHLRTYSRFARGANRAAAREEHRHVESRTPRRDRYGASFTLFAISRAVRSCGTGRRADDAAHGRIGFFPRRPAWQQRRHLGTGRDAFGIERSFFHFGFRVLHRA